MPVLTVQNGVGNEEMLAGYLPETPIVSGALTTPVEVIGPGQVKVARPSFDSASRRARAVLRSMTIAAYLPRRV